MEIPKRKVVVGNPAKIVKDVSAKMIKWKTKGTELYQQLPGRLHDSLKACEPLRELPQYRPKQEAVFDTWQKKKKQ